MDQHSQIFLVSEGKITNNKKDSGITFNVVSVTKRNFTVKILKFGTPQTIAIIVLKIEKFDVTLH